MAKKEPQIEIPILEISQGYFDAGIIFTTALFFNRMSEKSKRELLLPKGRKTSADKAATLKHDPMAEYQASVYRNSGNACPTRLCFPAPAFKGAMATAALDLPGVARTAIERLVWVEGYSIDIYGIPRLSMDPVRNSDQNRTPDIRTRAKLQKWGCVIRVNFVKPKLNARSIYNLLAAGGITCGIGDWRQEKGSGNFGQYRICDPEDQELLEIMKSGGRELQDEALLNPQFANAETEELFTWYTEQIAKRGIEEAPIRDSGRRRPPSQSPELPKEKSKPRRGRMPRITDTDLLAKRASKRDSEKTNGGRRYGR